jgi:hypothetical protein
MFSLRKYLLVLTLLLNFVIFGYSQKKQLLIFVGEKIEFMKDTVVDTENIGPEDYIVFYKIVKLLSGNPEKDTISCYTADEWHTPPELTTYENALVFLYKFEWPGEDHYRCLHDFDVYKTKDNQWASHYAWIEYYNNRRNIDVKPQKILFEKELSFDLSVCRDDEIKRWYPAPYYEIKDNRAIAVYGHYLDDLLELKKDSFYSRGFIY